jgi:hypothetical protein
MERGKRGRGGGGQRDIIRDATQTEGRRSSRLNRPIRGRQILNFVEVPVSGDEDHAVTFRRGGNPEVVFGKWAPGRD